MVRKEGDIEQRFEAEKGVSVWIMGEVFQEDSKNEYKSLSQEHAWLVE